MNDIPPTSPQRVKEAATSENQGRLVRAFPPGPLPQVASILDMKLVGAVRSMRVPSGTMLQVKRADPGIGPSSAVTPHLPAGTYAKAQEKNVEERAHSDPTSKERRKDKSITAILQSIRSVP